MSIRIAPLSKITPCYKCKKRTINCHDQCKKYEDWVAKNEKLKNELRANNVGTNNGWGYIRKGKK